MLSSGSGKNCTTSGERGGEGKEEKGKTFFHFFPLNILWLGVYYTVSISECIYRYNTFDTAEWKLGVLIIVLWLLKKRADRLSW